MAQVHASRNDPEGQLTVTVDGRSYRLDHRIHYGKGGKKKPSKHLYLRMSVGGRQCWINLKTSDRARAVVVAEERIRGGPPLKVGEDDFSQATVAQFLAAFKALGSVSLKTYRDYRNKVFGTVAWIKGIEVPIATRGPRRIAFELEVGAVRLSTIKEQDLMAWRERQVELCRRDSVNRKSPLSSNGQIAAWRAVFRKSSLWPLFGLTSFPGLGLKKLSAKKVIFRTLVPLQGLIDKAKQELKERDTDCYDLFLLATALGLRLKEADMLLWSAFEFDRKILNLKASVLYGYKSYHSEGEVKIYNDKVLAHFRSRFENRTSDFVLKSERPTGEDKDTTYYRCEPTSDRLKAWLRSQGVVCDKPIHYLRGAGGNQVRIDNDIFAAQCFLRHASVQTTIKFYSEVDTSYNTTLEF